MGNSREERVHFQVTIRWWSEPGDEEGHYAVFDYYDVAPPVPNVGETVSPCLASYGRDHQVFPTMKVMERHFDYWDRQARYPNGEVVAGRWKTGAAVLLVCEPVSEQDWELAEAWWKEQVEA